MSKQVIIFDDGEWLSVTPDHSYQGEVEYRIGEKLIIEDEKQVWVVRDVQHQFRRKRTDLLVYMMTCVIVSKWSEEEDLM